MAYGTLKVDNIIFTNGGVDQTITVSGIVASTSGNLTATGTISGAVIRGGTLVSGATVTGAAGQFTNITASGVSATTITGTTVTGTTATFASGIFTTLSGGTQTVTSGVFALGTAAAPSISFATDSDTGIYSPGAEQVAISTNGTGRLFVDASGNVSIATATSDAKFRVFGNTKIGEGVASPTGKLLVNTISGQAASIQLFQDGVESWIIQNPASSADLSFGNSGTERMRLDSTGRLGLGTSSPSATFDCRGNATFTGNGTARQTADFTNTGGQLYVGVESSAGGAVFTGSSAYAGIVGTNNSTSLQLASNGTVRATLDTSGRVGIGTTTVSKKLHIVSNGADGDVWVANGSGQNCLLEIAGNGNTLGSASALYGQDASNNVYAGWARGSHPVLFGTNNTERGRWDSSGRLLVGTSSARSNFYNDTNSAFIQLESASNDGSALALIQNFNANTLGSQLILAKSNAASVGSNTLVASDDACGRVSFQGNDGSQFVEAAQIRCDIDGTPGANDMPGRLVFSVTADGASSPTEALRISNNRAITVSDGGNVVLGTTTGTKIGTATTQKLGFYNATPVVQPTAVADATDAATAISQLNALLAHMRTLGLIAT
jgi:hypothetical protein